MGLRKMSRENLRKGRVPNKSGLYVLYNKQGDPIYVGHSKRLRHRLQSYMQEDDLKEHRTKRKLRSKAAYFSISKKPVSEARVKLPWRIKLYLWIMSSVLPKKLLNRERRNYEKYYKKHDGEW